MVILPKRNAKIIDTREFVRKVATAEDYLMAISQLQQEKKQDLVRIKDLAEYMGISPPSVSAYIRDPLEKDGLVIVMERKGVKLTDDGRKKAEFLLKRQIIVQKFLIDVLGLTKDEAHIEAHKLEHAVSDKVLERLETFLKRYTSENE